ncbi:MAG: hypothetical protein AB8F95_02125 [Bacteroidia bacterium]
MKTYLLLLLSILGLTTGASAQSGITFSGLFHQPSAKLTQQGFWAGGGARAQFLGKELLRGFPLRLQTGITASYLEGSRAVFGQSNQFGTLTLASSLVNHVVRGGVSARILTWPGKIRFYGEIEAGGQYFFSVLKNGNHVNDFISGNEYQTVASNLGLYTGIGVGVQFRILPFMFAQLGMNFTDGYGTQFVDLNSADYENNTLTYDVVSVGSAHFAEYNLGLYFRLGDHDNKRRDQKRGKRQRDNRKKDGNSRRVPNYWDRG